MNNSYDVYINGFWCGEASSNDDFIYILNEYKDRTDEHGEPMDFSTVELILETSP